MFQAETNRFYCPFYASLDQQTAITQMERGFHLPWMWHYYLEDCENAEAQQAGTGKCNPVAYGARSFRRNYLLRGDCRRGFGPAVSSPSSPPSPCPSCRPDGYLVVARRQRINRSEERRVGKEC